MVFFVCIESIGIDSRGNIIDMYFSRGIGAAIVSICTPVLVFAQSPQQKAATEAASFVAKVNEVILFPLIALLTAVAFLVFVWGVAQYFINATNDQARQQGVKHMTFGIIGLVVMLSAYAILSIAAATFGLDTQLDCANDPNQGGCDSAFTIP